jgi:hypothetical protein
VGEELDYRRQVVVRRILAKTEAVQELLAERLTLMQAAARFRDAESTGPAGWEPDRPATGDGQTDGERQCRAVIAWVRGWLTVHRPAEATEVVARLETELQRSRAPDGVVHLPDGFAVARRER